MIFSRPYARIATCVIAAGLAASCGPSDSGKKQSAESAGKAESAKTDAAVTGPIDPCTLLTKAEAQKILGAPVADARVTHDVGFAPGTRCSYFTSAPIEEAGAVWSVWVEVFDQATFDKQGSYFKSPSQAYQRGYKAAKSVSTNTVKDIAGVGDSAYWNGQQLTVLDRGVEVDLSVHANFHIPPGPGEKVDAEENADELHAATDLAKSIVLPRLEKL